MESTIILNQLKTLVHAGDLPAIAYHFATYIYEKSADDKVALAAALLSWQNTQGHICIELNDYANKAIQFKQGEDSEIIAPAISPWLLALSSHPWVSSNFPSPMILEDTRVYLGKYWKFESLLVTAINNRLNATITIDTLQLTSGLQRLFPKTEQQTDWQAVAASIALLNKFVVISGGPGTGKTSTVIRILALLLAQNPTMNIALVAPTGKAAARLAESIRDGKQNTRLSALTAEEKDLIPETAKTIHRFLKYSPKGFHHNAHNIVPVDTLVVDEASMVDLSLMTRLLTAIPETTHVILLGDRDQLSSVEAGSVLGDITGHGRDIQYSQAFIQQLEDIGAINKGDLLSPETTPAKIMQSIALLHKSYRFDDNSGIGQCAKLVNKNKGKQALFDVLLNSDYPDANWIDSDNESIDQPSLNWAIAHYQHYFTHKLVDDALHSFEQFRILSAVRTGAFGVDSLNTLIIEKLTRSKLIDSSEEFHGKPIMITQNDYELDLFNGDIGLMWRDKSNQQLRAYFRSIDGQIRSVPIRHLPQHETAFAMTIHKSQGSEFTKLLLVLPDKENPIVTKELIYTGITRAKKHIHITGNKAQFIKASQKTVQRSSGLAKKLY